MKLNDEFREALKQTCRRAANEIGSEKLRGLSWFYRNSVPANRITRESQQAAA